MTAKWEQWCIWQNQKRSIFQHRVLYHQEYHLSLDPKSRATWKTPESCLLLKLVRQLSLITVSDPHRGQEGTQLLKNKQTNKNPKSRSPYGAQTDLSLLSFLPQSDWFSQLLWRAVDIRQRREDLLRSVRPWVSFPNLTVEPESALLCKNSPQWETPHHRDSPSHTGSFVSLGLRLGIK